MPTRDTRPDLVSQPESDDTARGTVTRLLEDLDRGDHVALDAVFPLVYAELRNIAHHHRRQWQGDTTLGTTVLVHEAYLRLTGAKHVSARTRAHFLSLAARAMRQILCNYGRDRRALKRGGAVIELSLDHPEHEPHIGFFSDAQAGMLADLAEALDRLQGTDERLGKVVECRFFGGLSIEETAEALDTSPATVKRDWLLARAWLYREMNPD